MAAVSSVLLLIILGSRFIRLFQDVAEGSLALELLWTLLLLQLPYILELILPLGFFIAVMLAYGRLYQESEMGILLACGISPNKILSYTLVSAAFVAVLVSSLSLWITPMSEAKAASILEEQKRRVDFSTIKPGRFQSFSGGQVVYTEALENQNTQMKGVFLSRQFTNSKGENRTAVFKAEIGYQYLDEKTGSRYLVLEKGVRTEGNPGYKNVSQLSFDRYAVRLTENKTASTSVKIRQQPTSALFSATTPEQVAALQWRFSMPLMIIVVTLIAVPLSYVRPRQGRFAKLFPAIFIHIFYLSALISMQGMLEKQQISPALGMWLIHGIFITLGLALLFKEGMLSRLFTKRRVKQQVNAA